MAIKSPEFDLLSDLGGADDEWDAGLGGVLLSADYFAPAAAYPVKHFDGSTWLAGLLKQYDGAAWVAKQAKVYDGAVWQ